MQQLNLIICLAAAIDAATNVKEIPDRKDVLIRVRVEADPVPSIVDAPGPGGRGDTGAEAFQKAVLLVGAQVMHLLV